MAIRSRSTMVIFMAG